MAIVGCPDINQPVDGNKYRRCKKFYGNSWSFKCGQSRFKSLGKRQNDNAKDHRPNGTVRDNL